MYGVEGRNISVSLSFVIPCYNEAKHIASVIKRVHSMMVKASIDYEVIVMNNQSTDDSAVIAEREGAAVYTSTAHTVAQVRNDALQYLNGDVIVFLDGDVLLDCSWGDEIKNTLDAIQSNPNLITGSHCAAPRGSEGLLEVWYSAVEHDSRNTHLGTGHMIVDRELFTRSGMFDGTLLSGEDYDFCQRARAHGAVVVHNPKLRAYHLGYPTTIWDFIKRESWHGSSDFRSTFAVIQSKVAILSITFLALHLMVLYGVLSGSLHIVMVSAAALFIILMAATLYKFGGSHFFILCRRVFVMYLYCVGRTGSLWYLLTKRSRQYA